MEKKKEALKQYLGKWYSEDERRQAMLDDVVSGRAGVSLRTFDWFVTNYSARKSVAYERPSDGKMVVVNSDYKDLLRCFHKATFDSFKRRGKCKDDESSASLRQKNFFRWAIDNGVVDYVMKNAAEIESDMVRGKKQKKKRTTTRPPIIKEKRKKKGADELVTIRTFMQ
jgi:hypothetical protein